MLSLNEEPYTERFTGLAGTFYLSSVLVKYLHLIPALSQY